MTTAVAPRAAGEQRTLLLDLGGVACRFWPDRRLDALGQASGLSPDEVHRRLFASGFDQDCDRGRYTLDEQLAEICARLGVAWDQAELARLWARAFEPDTEVLDVVDSVRTRASTALLTNNGPLVHSMIERLFPEVAARFEARCFSYQVGALKPDPHAYLATLARLGVTPGQCVFVDDAEANVEGARLVGLEAFRFDSAAALLGELRVRGLAG